MCIFSGKYIHQFVQTMIFPCSIENSNHVSIDPGYNINIILRSSYCEADLNVEVYTHNDLTLFEV